MASYNFVFCVAILFLATIYAAPTEDKEFKIKIPTACKGQTFCSVKPEGYEFLEDQINNALPEFLIKDYGDRMGDEYETSVLSPKEDWHNCPYETKVVSSYLYIHDENVTKTDIIIQTKLFRQHVKIVSCADKHIDSTSSEQCFQGMAVNNFRMKSECVTSTVMRTLYVYDIERKKVVQRKYEVPACCRCKVSFDNKS